MPYKDRVKINEYRRRHYARLKEENPVKYEMLLEKARIINNKDYAEKKRKYINEPKDKVLEEKLNQWFQKNGYWENPNFDNSKDTAKFSQYDNSSEAVEFSTFRSKAGKSASSRRTKIRRSE